MKALTVAREVYSSKTVKLSQSYLSLEEAF